MLKSLVLVALAVAVGGCVLEVREQHPVYVRTAPVYVAPPSVVVDVPAYVEVGTVVDGVVVVEPVNADYVFIDGGWYFYGSGRWVHANHPSYWHPQGHVYHGWNEHPVYRQPDHGYRGPVNVPHDSPHDIHDSHLPPVGPPHNPVPPVHGPVPPPHGTVPLPNSHDQDGH